MNKKAIITILLAIVAMAGWAQVNSVSTQILVISDVHGRTFWKEAIVKYPDLPVVFLGDYLDPYAYENITQEDALANFKEILAFKQANMDKLCPRRTLRVDSQDSKQSPYGEQLR